MDRFICCKEPAKFEKTKNGFKCLYCGKMFLQKSLLWQNQVVDIQPNKIKKLEKYRGRKSDYLKSKCIYSTLETGKVNIYKKASGIFEYSKTIIVKKNVLKHLINKDGKLITVSESGVIDVYDIESETKISSFKTEYSYRHIEICPELNGWLYLDKEKIIWLSSDCSQRESILTFSDINIEDVWHVEKIESNDSNEFYAFFWYRDEENQPSKVGVTKIERDLKKGFKYSFMSFPFKYYSYDFKEESFYGIEDKKSFLKFNSKKKDVEVPIVQKYSDGGGVFWVEEFFDYPNNVHRIKEDVFYLKYYHDFIVYNIKTHMIINWYDFGSDLIQSVVIIDENMISVSAGLNSYIVTV
jgi:hypothetical protein